MKGVNNNFEMLRSWKQKTGLQNKFLEEIRNERHQVCKNVTKHGRAITHTHKRTNSVAIKTMQGDAENWKHRRMKGSISLKRAVYTSKDIYRTRETLKFFNVTLGARKGQTNGKW